MRRIIGVFQWIWKWYGPIFIFTLLGIFWVAPIIAYAYYEINFHINVFPDVQGYFLFNLLMTAFLTFGALTLIGERKPE